MPAIRHLIVVAASLPADESMPEGIRPEDAWAALADRMHKASHFLHRFLICFAYARAEALALFG